MRGLAPRVRVAPSFGRGAARARDWRSNRAWRYGAESIDSYSRAGYASATDSAGVATLLEADEEPRNDLGLQNRPATDAGASLIRNPNFIGAGYFRFPTNCSASSVSGVVYSCEGSEVIDGVDCWILVGAGTASGVAADFIFLQSTTSESIAQNNKLKGGVWMKLLSGGFSNVTICQVLTRMQTSVGGVDSTPVSNTSVLPDGTFRSYPLSYNDSEYKVTSATAAYPRLMLRLVTKAGAVSFRLAIGKARLSKNAEPVFLPNPPNPPGPNLAPNAALVGCTKDAAISSGTYVSATGVVTLTMAGAIGFAGVGSTVIVSGLTGSGTNLAQLNGQFLALAGTTGTTVVFNGGSGKGTISISGGLLDSLPDGWEYFSSTPLTLKVTQATGNPRIKFTGTIAGTPSVSFLGMSPKNVAAMAADDGAAGVGADIMTTTVTVAEIGSTTGVSARRLGGHEIDTNGSTIRVTTTNEPIITLDSTLREQRSVYTIANSLTGFWQPGMILTPTQAVAVSCEWEFAVNSLNVDINNVVTSTAPLRSADVHTYEAAGLVGASGGLCVRFMPREKQTSYDILKIASASAPTTYVRVRYKDATTCVFQPTVLGVDGAETTLLSERLSERMESAVAVDFNGTHTFVAVNGNLATIAAPLPFSDAIVATFGPVGDVITEDSCWMASHGAPYVANLTSYKGETIYQVVVAGQSNEKAAHGFVTGTDEALDQNLPPVFWSPRSAVPRVLGFLITPDSASAGGFRPSGHYSNGSNRNNGNVTGSEMAMAGTLLAFKELREHQLTSAADGVSGLLAMGLAIAEAAGPRGYVVLSTIAVGGSSIDGMCKVPDVVYPNGRVPYDDAIECWTRGKALALAQGRSYRFLAWVHGSHFQDVDHSVEYTFDKFEEIRGTVTADIAALNPGQVAPYFVTTILGVATSESIYPCLAGLELHVAGNWTIGHTQYPDMWLGTPGRGGFDTDWLHTKADGKAWAGEDLGACIVQLMAGARRDRLRMTGVVRSTTKLVCSFNIPAPNTGLVLSDAIIDDPGHYGFRVLKDSDGSPITISSVAVVGSTVEVECGLTNDDWRIGYADLGYVTAAPFVKDEQMRGCLRGDALLGNYEYDGSPQYDWCEPFTFPYDRTDDP